MSVSHTSLPLPVRTSRPASFEVHLDELRRFAQTLAAQADALSGQRSELGTLQPLADRRDLLGDFVEAESLAAVHALALQRLEDLHARVEAMIRFADSVADDVANHYERHDGHADEAFRALRPDEQAADPGAPTWT